jgi:hypothetical protein
MQIHLSTLKLWARQKAPPNVGVKHARVWRRFAIVRLNGQPVAVPAKAAVAWMRSTAATVATVTPAGIDLAAGSSRVRLKCWPDDVPCESAYDPRPLYNWSRPSFQPISDRAPISALVTQ